MKTDHRFLELDALRGLAAIAVVLFHYSLTENKELLGWNFRYGITGVDLFFMISGFVICLTANRTRHWFDFVVFRFARLYPAFWACLFITLLFMAIYEPNQLNLSDTTANATMAPALFNVEDIDGSYWTLLVELIFYGWMLFILMAGKLGSIVRIGAFTVIATIGFHVFAPYYPAFYTYAGNKLQLINHFPLFYSGILFFQLKKNSPRLHITGLMLFSMLAALYLHDKGGRSMHIVNFTEHSILIIGYHLIFALLIAGKLQFLNWKPLLFLGKISYCLYLIHQYVGTRLISTFTGQLGLNIYVALLLTFAIVISLASLVTFLVEIPANADIRQRYAMSRGVLIPIKGQHPRSMKKLPF